ncbi:unnamed protein product [Cyprideis torosa]|uniref:Uncharacterized protein n=1 Tax=Cyprideis torosa TaxID=163714 RepID=A0A7R8W673_9CRUS|nr:unnamed protein product [Cyprideis torosa]CAG0884925.1 unnamed protein product [Cyprideis torosa]
MYLGIFSGFPLGCVFPVWLWKRQVKDFKYGYGGQKKRSKYNTKESNDNVGPTFRQMGRKGKGGGAFKGKQKRPGKDARRKNKR